MISKVCIVTNYKNTGNYGALLQAYALNRVISDLGFECETLNFNLNEQNGTKLFRYYNRIKRKEFVCLAGDIKRDLGKFIVRGKILKRKKALNRFRNNIPHTEFYTFNNISKINDRYDCYICGSDQIWRPTHEGNLVGIYWLDVINCNCVKASYAASIGIDQLPDSLTSRVQELLSSFNYISVRENSAKEYLSKIVDKEIEVSIDPVFLLEKNKWESIAKYPKESDSYIFVYMIHGSKSLLKSISEYARLNNMTIVTFPYMAYYFRKEELLFGDIKIFDADPSEFIGYIKNAECVFTDSFHATAFSIILHKYFYVSSANEVAFSRIENLLSASGIMGRTIPKNGFHPSMYNNEISIDWKVVDRNLNSVICNSKGYLEKILNT